MFYFLDRSGSVSDTKSRAQTFKDLKKKVVWIAQLVI